MANENTVGYVHFYPPAKPDVKFKTELSYQLVNTLEMLQAFFEDYEDKPIAFDTETTGLDMENDRIVGFSLSKNPYSGIYVPLRHLPGGNIPNVKKVMHLLYEFLKKNRVLMYNALFDLLMLYYEESFDTPPDVEELKIFEVQALVFNADTNVSKNNLKWAARHFLGRECPEFNEVLGKKARFDALDPEDAVYYAVCDTANTFGLYKVLSPPLTQECKFTIKLDNELTKAFTYYLREWIYFDNDSMTALEKEIKERIRNIEKEIFRAIGYPFNIGSSRATTQALLSIGVDTGRRTTRGDMGLSEKDLVKVDHPIAKKIVERASLEKQLSSYVKKFTTQPRGRISYQLFNAPTGRFSSGNKKNPYFMKINGQNLTKPKPAMYIAYEDHGPLSIEGWGFELVDEEYMKAHPDEYYVEGKSPKMNVRNAITIESKEERYFVSYDYSQEELFLAGFMSKDRVLCEAFINGEDVHKKTAMSMFSEYDKQKRKYAKIANFGLLYDGNEHTIQESSGLPLDKCVEIYNAYWTALSVSIV